MFANFIRSDEYGAFFGVKTKKSSIANTPQPY